MEHKINNRVHHYNCTNFRNLSLSGVEKKIGFPNFLNEDMNSVKIGNFEIFRRDPESVLNSLVFGIPIIYIAIVGTIIWIIKSK